MGGFTIIIVNNYSIVKKRTDTIDAIISLTLLFDSSGVAKGGPGRARARPIVPTIRRGDILVPRLLIWERDYKDLLSQ